MGDSWFFAKYIEVQYYINIKLRVEHSNCEVYLKNISKHDETPNINLIYYNKQTLSAKVQSQKGNSPD